MGRLRRSSRLRVCGRETSRYAVACDESWRVAARNVRIRTRDLRGGLAPVTERMFTPLSRARQRRRVARMSEHGSAPRFFHAHETAHELASLHSRAVTFHTDDGLVERMLVEPSDYVADVIDAMLAAAHAKLDADQAPSDAVTAELADLLDDLDHRSRLRRARAAADWLTGALPR